MSIENYNFKDLIDINEFKKLLDSFYEATGIPNGLVDESGELLTQAGWSEACNKFHRANPATNKLCQESNIQLMNNLRDGEVVHSICKNGLVDYATPIVIEGKRLATIFLGQVLNKAPDLKFFEHHADTYGYDKKSYIKSIEKVQIVPQEKLEKLMETLVVMAKMLASNTLANINQNILENDLFKTKEKSVQLEDILNSSPVGIGWSNTKTRKIEYINQSFIDLFGYTLDDIKTIDDWYEKAYPDKKYTEEVVFPKYEKVAQAYAKGKPIPDIEVNVTCKDGTERHIIIRFAFTGDKRIVNFSDMTAHWKSEKRNQAHDSMLEMVARGAPLVDILHAIVLAIESEDTTSKCSILLIDENNCFKNGATFSLPKFYNNAIEGLEIGYGVGSCGTAAYTKKRVIVSDIMNHEYWAPYKELAKKANLSACWSEPIIDSEGNVLGTFAIYHDKPTEPTSVDIERVTFAANLAAIAIENRKAHEKLEQLAFSDPLTGLNNRRAFIEYSNKEISRHNRYDGKLSLFMFDLDYFKQVNDTYGHNYGDKVLINVATICKETLREFDIAGRIGGEEFAVLLPQTDLTMAKQVAQRLLDMMHEQEVTCDNGDKIKYTASFGVVCSEDKPTSIDEMLKNADDALYNAKNSGRDQIYIG